MVTSGVTMVKKSLPYEKHQFHEKWEPARPMHFAGVGGSGPFWKGKRSTSTRRIEHQKKGGGKGERGMRGLCLHIKEKHQKKRSAKNAVCEG